ncbi:MAG: flavodoxin family protein [Lentisphaerae bacterium]|nr:flavodoxin family protein [Lentisphaerota bacterium]
MKKVYAVNGSPRSNGNTATVLRHALAGAESTGAETELIDLGKLNFSGCRSCFACKLKEGGTPGCCALRDQLTAVLEKLGNADAVIMGSPVYFGAETGLFRNFMERLFFPYLQYTDPVSTAMKRKIETAFIYTMNIPQEAVENFGYRDFFDRTRRFPQIVFNSSEVETLYVCNTFQFSDYSKYVSSMFNAEEKAKARKEQFPIDCQKAFELGKRIALK